MFSKEEAEGEEKEEEEEAAMEEEEEAAMEEEEEEDRVLRRPTHRPSTEPSPEFCRQHRLLRSRGDTLGGISFPKRRTHRIVRFVRTSTGNVSPLLQKRVDRQRTAI